MRAESPSQELLKSWLSYNKETGEFYWKRKFQIGESRVGKLAGTLKMNKRGGSNGAPSSVICALVDRMARDG